MAVTNRDLFYRPDLKPKKDYMSEADFPEEPELISEEPEEEERDLGEEIDDIIEVADILPDRIRNILMPVLERIRDEVDGLSMPEEKTAPEEEPEEVPESELPDEPSFFPERPPITIRVQMPDPIPVVIRDVYNIDLIHIYRDFVIKLKKALADFIRELLYVARIGEFANYKDLLKDYKAEASDVAKDFRHVSDEIVRTQVKRDQKTRFLRKVFNIDQTIYHLRAVKSSYELRKRYYEEEYQKPKDYLDTHANDFLRLSRTQYDAKYKKNMYNLYKYLNSAVILVNETLQLHLIEAKGKAILKRQGVDIFKENETAEPKKNDELLKGQREQQQPLSIKPANNDRDKLME